MKTIYFDFFGVIATPVYAKVIKAFIPVEEHEAWMKKLDLLDVGTLTETSLVKRIAERAQTSEKAIWEAVKSAPQVNQPLLRFIKDQLKGRFTVGLLTNIPKSLLESIIPQELSLFDIALISSELKLVKPDPKIFEVAIERAHCLKSEIVFIDDGEKNVAVANSLGIQGIVYKDFTSFLIAIEPHLAF